MKPAPFRYERARDLDCVLGLLADQNGMAKVVAGGQSIGPMLNLRLVEPQLVVDISSLAELTFAECDGKELVLGACITHADIEDGRVPDVTRGAMRRVAGGIAYRAVRNRGTIGGSLSHADPAADWITALISLDARVTVRSHAGVRWLPVAEFIVGALETALESYEILDTVRVPVMAQTARWGYVKACRKVGEFAHAIGAVLIDPETGRARAVIGAVDAAPILISDASSLFGGRVGGDFTLRFDAAAADALLASAGMSDPVDRHLHVTVLRRAVAEAAQ